MFFIEKIFFVMKIDKKKLIILFIIIFKQIHLFFLFFVMI
jgi:hypothetical protein